MTVKLDDCCSHFISWINSLPEALVWRQAVWTGQVDVPQYELERKNSQTEEISKLSVTWIVHLGLAWPKNPCKCLLVGAHTPIIGLLHASLCTAQPLCAARAIFRYYRAVLGGDFRDQVTTAYFSDSVVNSLSFLVWEKGRDYLFMDAPFSCNPWYLQTGDQAIQWHCLKVRKNG